MTGEDVNRIAELCVNEEELLAFDSYAKSPSEDYGYVEL